MIELDDVPERFRSAVLATLTVAGVTDGHIAVEVVDEERIQELNRAFRAVDRPTDVLSFPVDGIGPGAGPRELGDVAICPTECANELEAVVHGVLHLCGHDHETDDGEMLVLQASVLSSLGIRPTISVSDE